MPRSGGALRWATVGLMALLMLLISLGSAESAPSAQWEGRAVFALGFEPAAEGAGEDAQENLVLAVVQSTQPVVVAAFAKAGQGTLRLGAPPDDSVPTNPGGEAGGAPPDDNVPGQAGLVFYEAKAGDALNIPQPAGNVFKAPIFEILQNTDDLSNVPGAELLAAGRLFALDDEARGVFQAGSGIDPAQAFNQAMAKAVGNLAGGFNFQGPPPPPPGGGPGGPPPPFFLPPELADIFGNHGNLAQGIANFLPIIAGPPAPPGGGGGPGGPGGPLLPPPDFFRVFQGGPNGPGGPAGPNGPASFFDPGKFFVGPAALPPEFQNFGNAFKQGGGNEVVGKFYGEFPPVPFAGGGPPGGPGFDPTAFFTSFFGGIDTGGFSEFKEGLIPCGVPGKPICPDFPGLAGPCGLAGQPPCPEFPLPGGPLGPCGGQDQPPCPTFPGGPAACGGANQPPCPGGPVGPIACGAPAQPPCPDFPGGPIACGAPQQPPCPQNPDGVPGGAGPCGAVGQPPCPKPGAGAGPCGGANQPPCPGPGAGGLPDGALGCGGPAGPPCPQPPEGQPGGQPPPPPPPTGAPPPPPPTGAPPP
ncbi:MAG: hypothetical protein FJ320_06800, partial [SAR202 cluster bacterium]|nr:hypothetical protein [SAR202 cluster bacterium]